MTGPLDMALLRSIAARPRPSGSDGIALARQRCARELSGMGFDVREVEFSFSAFPGRFATPLLGGAAALAVGFAGQWGAQGRPFAPLALLSLGAIAMLASGLWLTRHGVIAAPVLRQRGINLEATKRRTAERPTVWLCAHLDTKSQPVPTLVRTIGIVLEGLGYLWTLGLCVAVALGMAPLRLQWELAAATTLIGAFPVVLSVVGRRSPGALDNASGVVTVIAATRQLDERTDVGVLLTDGEELGLAGARAWAGASPNREGDYYVLNCDGVDDKGRIEVMFTPLRGRGSRRVGGGEPRHPHALLDAVRAAGDRTRIPFKAGRLIPAVLTDSAAFADAGMESVTFSRGSWRSLARVHTTRDDLKHLDGAGVGETARLMAETARRLAEG